MKKKFSGILSFRTVIMSSLLFTPFFDFSGKKEILMTWQLLILGFLQDPCPKFKWNNLRFIKVQLFWEGHKNLRYVLFGFDIYLVSVKTMRKIAQIFVAFSEKLNFINSIKLKRFSLFYSDDELRFMYENGQGHLTLFYIVFVWLRGQPSSVRVITQIPGLCIKTN